MHSTAQAIIFGGAVSDNAASNPTDITVRWNLMTKPLSWKSQSYDVKNIFQLKNAQRVLLEGNVLEYVWADQQAGNAIVFTIRSEGAHPSPHSTSHCLLRSNV